jgi:hypothetical protein
MPTLKLRSRTRQHGESVEIEPLAFYHSARRPERNRRNDNAPKTQWFPRRLIAQKAGGHPVVWPLDADFRAWPTA